MRVGNTGRDTVIDIGVVIEKGSYVDDFSRIGKYTQLKPGTLIGKRCKVDDFCIFSGQCDVGNDTVIRYHSIIARNVHIGNGVYIAPKVMFEYKDADRNPSTTPTNVGDGAFIGTGAVIKAGVSIGPGAKVGSMALVTKDVPAGAIVIGIPAREIKVNETTDPKLAQDGGA